MGGELPAFDPDLANFLLGIEVARAVHDGEVGELSFFDGAELRGEAAELGGNGGERGEGVSFGETAVEGELEIFAEGFAVAEGVGGEGNFEARAAEGDGIFAGEIPGAELVEGDVGPVVFVGEFGGGGEINGDDAGEGGGFGEVGATPFVAAGAEDGGEVELAREAGGAVEHEGAAGFDDDGDLLLQRGVEGLEGGVEGGAGAGGIFGVIGVVEFVVLGVEEGLARDGDDAHERRGVSAVFAARGLEGEVLEDIGFEDGLIGVAVAEQDEGAGAAEDAFGGDDVAGGEADFAEFLEGFGIGSVGVGDAKLRRDATDFVAGTGRSAALGRFDAEEINAAGGGDRDGHCGADGRGGAGAGEREIRVDEAGVDGCAFEIPHARVGRRAEIFADGFDATVADDDGGRVESLGGADDDLCADEGVDGGRLWAMAGWEEVGGECRDGQKDDADEDAEGASDGWGRGSGDTRRV